MGNYSYQYQKARKEWKASLGPRPVCWLCDDVIDIELHHYSRDSFELDHMYPVSEYPHLANDPQFFRPSHKKCNASRKAHGWTADEFRTRSATSKKTDTSTINPLVFTHQESVDDDFDDDDVAYPIGIAKPAKTASSSAARAVPVVSVDSASAKKATLFKNAIPQDKDPKPHMYSREWDCDHPNTMPTKQCDRCMAYRAVRIGHIRAWESRHPNSMC
jgi:hypothetical protein